ncbi:MAG: TonB-dependent receptor [Proteobacteria bacterium]|nr:TonB-dependent receptor [Pseudomonadota bacterium]
MSIYKPFRAALAAGTLVAMSVPVLAQEAGADIVLTPDRSAQAISRSGSAVTVIRRDDIEKSGSTNLADVLRQMPGVTIVENGGRGQSAFARIRGGEARHTLVLIDGIRANDPSIGAGEFDFASLVAADIERIEVLRGPQSALYGSDASGGVINIITRKGRGGYRGSASIETGRYGSTLGFAAISGGNKDLDYSLSLAGEKGAGYSAYGYRIGRLERPAGYKFENDAFARLGGAARLGWRPTQDFGIEAGLTSSYNKAQYDEAWGRFPDTPSKADARLTTAFVKASLDTFDNRLKNTLSVYGQYSDRKYSSVSYWDYGFGLGRTWDKYHYNGKRYGAEYQGDLKLDQFGKLIFGGKIETEGLSSRTDPIENSWNMAEKFSVTQQTRSAFALWQLPVGERLDLSFGGRIDDVENADRFATWRMTGAYRITELGTKLRASAGTGGKAPSLFQLYSPQYGTRNLEAEHSFGVDAGIDQTLFGGRLTLSATAFHNRYRNLIDFSPYDLATYSYPVCPASQRYTGCYLNIGRAHMNGVELSADAVLIEGFLTARAFYTHLVAIDKLTDKHLPRRPENEGKLAFRITPIDKLTIEPTVRLVGERYSSANETLRLAPYARFDLRVDYQLHKNLNIYARADNLTNAKYQEVYNYGSTGRAFFAGARAIW